MLVNKSTVGAIFVNLRTEFMKAFATAKPKWQKIATKIPSTTSEEIYTWFSKFPKMRKWLDEKLIKKLKGFKYVIVNDDYEATIEVDRNDIKDERLGGYKIQAAGAGQSAAEWPDDIVGEALNGAFVLKCYDGQYFCDTDHPVTDKDGVVQSVSNKSTAPLSWASLAAAQAGYGNARSGMKQFKDDEGRPLKVNPNILVVGPAKEDDAKALMTKDKFQDGTENIYKGTAEVEVWPEIESDTAWFLLDTTKPIKPFLFQEREKPVLVSQTDPEAEGVFKRKKFLFGAEARGASGVTFWQLIWGSTGTG